MPVKKDVIKRLANREYVNTVKDATVVIVPDGTTLLPGHFKKCRIISLKTFKAANRRRKKAEAYEVRDSLGNTTGVLTVPYAMRLEGKASFLEPDVFSQFMSVKNYSIDPKTYARADAPVKPATGSLSGNVMNHIERLRAERTGQPTKPPKPVVEQSAPVGLPEPVGKSDSGDDEVAAESDSGDDEAEAESDSDDDVFHNAKDARAVNRLLGQRIEIQHEDMKKHFESMIDKFVDMYKTQDEYINMDSILSATSETGMKDAIENMSYNNIITVCKLFREMRNSGPYFSSHDISEVDLYGWNEIKKLIDTGNGDQLKLYRLYPLSIGSLISNAITLMQSAHDSIRVRSINIYNDKSNFSMINAKDFMIDICRFMVRIDVDRAVYSNPCAMSEEHIDIITNMLGADRGDYLVYINDFIETLNSTTMGNYKLDDLRHYINGRSFEELVKSYTKVVASGVDDARKLALKGLILVSIGVLNCHELSTIKGKLATALGIKNNTNMLLKWFGVN